MAREIERKFLVKGNAWRNLAPGVLFRQGYLNDAKERTVRIRTMGDRAVLTVKGPNHGIERAEFEYEIPFADCSLMLDTLALRPLIEKTRYRIPFKGFVWEVDEFHGANDGLIVAEIELPSADTFFEKPDWVGEEVSGDVRYYNSSLISRPFSTWN